MRQVVFGLCTLLLIAASAWQSAEARPKYLAEFKKKYPDVTEAVNEAKCNVCHVGSNKKDLNPYGTTLGQLLAEKNVKETEKIVKGFVESETKNSTTTGKTFGQLLKEKLLPVAAAD